MTYDHLIRDLAIEGERYDDLTDDTLLECAIAYFRDHPQEIGEVFGDDADVLALTNRLERVREADASDDAVRKTLARLQLADFLVCAVGTAAAPWIRMDLDYQLDCERERRECAEENRREDRHEAYLRGIV